MTALIAILSFLAIIIVIVIAHELGHFVTAKLTGVTVLEFGLFYPPRLLSFKYKGTIYSLNAIPLGGFVKMAGEEDPDAEGSLAGKKTPVKLLVLSAGSIMNLILPILLFSIAFMVPHNTIEGKAVIQGVSENSPAAAAGILPGDTILEMNGKAITNIADVSRVIQLKLGQEITLTLQREDGSIDTVSAIPRWKPPEGQGAFGILLATEDAQVLKTSYPFWKAIPMGFSMCIDTFILFKNGIVSMIIGTVPVQLSGPVGIAQMSGEIARAGMSPLLEFAAFLSMNLAIINLFPLPALDGGRIVFVLIQWARRGKRISPKTEGWVHAAGFALLMVFFLIITFQDIMRIISGESLLG